MKIVKIWEGCAALKSQNYILSFTSEELFFLCPLLKNILYFITIEGNDIFFERKFKNFKKKTKFGLIESQGVPISSSVVDDLLDTTYPYAYAKDIRDIVQVEKDSDCEDFTWCRTIGYRGNSREFGYDVASIAKHFGLNKDSLARGIFRRSPELIEANEHILHFNVTGHHLARCLDKIDGIKLSMYGLFPSRKILVRFVELCREEIKIYKKEEKDFAEYQRKNPDIIF